MRRKAKEILQDVKEEVEKYNITVKTSQSYKVIVESERCFGYFLPPENRKKGKLVVATGDKRHVDYLWDLAHELAHFRQWRRDDPIYLKHLKDDSAYYVLEHKTEKEAKKIFSNWGIRISDRLKKRSKKYLKTIAQ